MARPLRIDWDAQPLGEVSDRELSERLGCSKRAVALARNTRGIQPCSGPQAWTPEQDRKLRWLWGTASATAIARAIPGPHRTAYAVRYRADRLGLGSPGRGTMTLRELADHLGVAKATAARLLRAAGVTPRRRPPSGKGKLGSMQGRPMALSLEQVQRVEAQLLSEME